MNAVNLQLKQMNLAVAALNELLIKKGVASRSELNFAMRIARSRSGMRGSTTSSISRAPIGITTSEPGDDDGPIDPFTQVGKLGS